ncbi:hypothetical protein C8Q73DRAFT_687421 [Cubamyces lactineus]|nr:hypothetical protein C8Q73DRAFT_687421 [Cubamyces lactineus]
MNRTSITLLDTAKQQSRCVSHTLKTTRDYSASATSTSKARVSSPNPLADRFGRTTDPNDFTYSSSAWYYTKSPPPQSSATSRSNSPTPVLSRSPMLAVLRTSSGDRLTTKTIAPRTSRQSVPSLEAHKVPHATAKPRAPMAMSPFRLRREHAINKFTAFIKEQYGEQFQVRVFGSTCYGASSRCSSDIDLTIFDSERPYGIEPEDKRPLPAIYAVNRLAKRLRHYGYLDVSSIAKASVPIVKCTEPETGVTFDVNVNNRLGVYNTALLRQYCLLNRTLPYLLKVVKLWMHSKYLNKASGMDGPPSFSSYAITLMTIALYQHHNLLPNLQADEDTIVQTHFWEKRGGVRRRVDVRFGACKTWRLYPSARPPTLRQWFEFWANKFDFDKRMVSIRDGGFVDRPSEVPGIWGPPIPDTANIVVLDPFTFKNCTHMISAETLARFKQECVNMLDRMENKAYNKALQEHVSLVADPNYSNHAMDTLERTFFPRKPR